MTEQHPVLIRASEVVSTPVQWLWPGWLPAGKIVLLQGNPGCGKSTLAIDLVASITTGRPLPSGKATDPVDALIFSAEDGIEDTIRPRLDAAGADVAKVHLWEPSSPMFQLPRTANWLRDKILEHDIRLVVLDTLLCFLGAGINSHHAQDVRRALTPVFQVASETGATVLALRHLSKSAGPSAMNRGMGSIAFTGLARAVWHAGTHPDEKGMVLSIVKNNLAVTERSRRYEVVDNDGQPVIDWGDTCDLVADDLVVEPTYSPSALTAAMEWLQGALSNGPVPSSQIVVDAGQDGIAEATLRRAKKDLGVKSLRTNGAWSFELPAQHAQHAQAM